MTKSPPTKRVKGHHDVEMEIDNDKDKQIMELKSTVNLLKQKLQNLEINMTQSLTPSALVAADLNVSSGILNNEQINIAENNLAFQYTCEICKKGFTNKRNFQNHKKDHTGKPSYATILQVKENCTTDKTEKPTKVKFSEIHNCEQCGNVFINKTLLEN